ncbi:MAG: choice-of-anchor B family protein [Bacteroidota bacterium]
MMRFVSLLACLLCFCHAQAQRPPLNMSLLGGYHDDSLPSLGGQVYNDIWGYTDCNGREYAIIGSIEQVHFIDIDHPDGPREVARFRGGGSNFWRDFKTYRDRAYAVSDQAFEGMMIFDLSQLPDTVIQTNHTKNYFTNAHNIFVDEENGRLYAAGSDTANLVVLDLTQDPDTPALLSNARLFGAGYVHDVYVRDNIAYCSQGNNGYFIWDMNEPTNPQLLASTRTFGYNHSSWLTEDGQYAIYAEEVPTGVPMGIIDLSEVDDGLVSIVNTFKFPLEAPIDSNPRPHNPFIRDHYAVVSYYQDGLQIFDIADPMNPKQVAHFDTYENSTYPAREFEGNWGAYPYLPSGRILASDMRRGLLVLSADSIQWDTIVATTLPQATIEAVPDKVVYCPGDTVLLQAPDSNGEYFWTIGGDVLYGTEQQIEVAQADTFQLEMILEHCQSTTEIGIAYSDIESPTISLDGIRLFTFVNGVSYQWYLDGEPIDGATNVLYDASQSGMYFLEITDENGCTARSETLEVIVTSTSQPDDLSIHISPNPVSQFTNLSFSRPPNQAVQLQLYDLSGKLLWKQEWADGGSTTKEMDLRFLPAGLYFLHIQVGEQLSVQKMVKE